MLAVPEDQPVSLCTGLPDGHCQGMYCTGGFCAAHSCNDTGLLVAVQVPRLKSAHKITPRLFVTWEPLTTLCCLTWFLALHW